jgi:hypothetical protein
MSARRLGTFVLCLACVQCGGQTPVGPTSGASPSTLPPETSSPQPVTPPSILPQVFVGAGDIAMCDQNSEATAKLLDTIGGTVFTLGDNAYFHGTRQEFRDCYQPTWGRHKARTRPVPGNHDYGSPDAAPYFEYFGANAGPAGLGYYSFEVGAWHVVALNSNIDLGAQVAWLRSDLADSRTRCTIAYWHHPLFSSGPQGRSPAMREFWRLLHDAGAEIVLNGHEHLYERFAPQDSDGRADPSAGIRQFIVGTGGALLYGPSVAQTNSEVRISAFGVLKLTLARDSYQWEFIRVSGAGDSGSGQCH